MRTSSCAGELVFASMFVDENEEQFVLAAAERRVGRDAVSSRALPKDWCRSAVHLEACNRHARGSYDPAGLSRGFLELVGVGSSRWKAWLKMYRQSGVG